MLIPDIDSINSTARTEKYFRHHFNEFSLYLDKKYGDIKFSEKIYLYYHDISQPPICPVCGKHLELLSFEKGYRKFCSYKCSSNCTDTKLKRSNTCIQKYGVDNPGKSEELKCRAARTCIQKYGVDNPSKLDAIKAKKKETLTQNYGVEHPMQSETIKNKHKTTLHNNIIQKRGNIIDITEENLYTYKCPHSECSLCKERLFVSPRTIYETRLKRGIEVCTNILPLGSKSNTNIEQFIRNILDREHIKYQTNIRSIIDGKELDIYIPDKKIAIECNGIFWHSTRILKNKSSHIDKLKRCREKNIQLITIWEDWIKNYPDKIASIIKSKVGIFNRRIYARKCTVKKIDSVSCRAFLEKYHLQGNINSSIRYGLYYNDELVSVMAFGRGRVCMRGNTDSYELYRYCCKNDTQIIGGASRLFERFKRDYNPHEVISFSSNDISNGDLYRHLGFFKSGETQSYWYIDPRTNKRYHRYSFTKKNLIEQGFDPNKTELEIMIDRGYLPIFDSGQSKWVFNNLY